MRPPVETNACLRQNENRSEMRLRGNGLCRLSLEEALPRIAAHPVIARQT